NPWSPGVVDPGAPTGRPCDERGSPRWGYNSSFAPLPGVPLAFGSLHPWLLPVTPTGSQTRHRLNRNSREFTSTQSRSCKPSRGVGADFTQPSALANSSADGGRDSVTRYSSSTAFAASSFSTRPDLSPIFLFR